MPIVLSGCWDYKDVNKRSITLSVGVDYVNDNVEFTGEIAKLGTKTGGEQAQVTDVYNFKSIGNNFENSRADFDSKIPLTDFSGAQRLVVFSKKYATKGIESYINRAYHLSGIRKSVLIAVCKEPTSELFSGKIENDISTGYAIENTVRYLDANGETLYKTMQQINSDIMHKDVGYLLPYVTKNKNNIKYLGFAAMKDSKLVGIINSEDSTGYLFILSEKPVAQIAISKTSSDKNLVSIKTDLKKRTIKTSYEDKVVNIYINLKLNAQLQYEYNNIPVSDEDIKNLEDRVSKKFEEDIIYATNHSKSEFQSDVFGFSQYFKSQNPQKYREIDWKKEYTKAVFHVNVETTIINKNLSDPNAKKPS